MYHQSLNGTLYCIQQHFAVFEMHHTVVVLYNITATS